MGKGKAKTKRTKSKYAVKFAKRSRLAKKIGAYVSNSKGKRLPFPLPIIIGLNGAKVG
jgi:hypothetical protein